MHRQPRHHRKRRKPRFHHHTKPGALPGMLQAAPDTPPPVMQVISFDKDRLIEEPIEEIKQLQAHLDKGVVTWLNVDGLGDVMKVLTIIATIFIPLSFVAGLYGMNFNTELPGNMPELNWPYGYLAAISLMLFIAFGMLIYFWRRGWIGPTRPPPRV